MSKIINLKNKVFVLLLIAILSFKGYVFPQEQASMEDRLISSTFKTLAKTFVLMTDIDKLKEDNIDKIVRMDKDKFQKRYARIYEIIKDLPYNLRSRYAITEKMTKWQAIKDVESLDKGKIYEIIDLVPDKIIADQFRLRLRHRKQNVQKDNLITQINHYWNDLMKKMNMSTPQPAQH